MLAQRALLRSTRLMTPKSPVARGGSRSYSAPGAQDSAFNKEREAVKHHAAESAGMSTYPFTTASSVAVVPNFTDCQPELWRKLSI
jgi:hypothetical protein